MKVIKIIGILLVGFIVIGLANAAERRPSISETKESIERSLDIMVPHAENLKRDGISVEYTAADKVAHIASISCYKYVAKADLDYDQELIFVWQNFGDKGVASIIAHELAHCSNANEVMKNSYDKEYNADLGGFDIYYKSNYGPQSYLDVYKNFLEKWGNQAGKTHPSEQARIDNVKKYARMKYGLELK